MNTNQSSAERYDIIPDLHGYAEPLTHLLDLLGYVIQDACFRHPQRKVIFLGDVIDKGPQVRETLQIVRAIVEEGAALAIMGNHELKRTRLPHAGRCWRFPAAAYGEEHPATRDDLRAFEGREGELHDYQPGSSSHNPGFTCSPGCGYAVHKAPLRGAKKCVFKKGSFFEHGRTGRSPSRHCGTIGEAKDSAERLA